MDPLVKKLKDESESRARQSQIDAQVRLLRHQHLTAKAPRFWELTCQHVCQIGMEMQQNLPPAECLKTERHSGDITIRGTSYPRVTLTASLSMPLQEIQIDEDTMYSAGDTPIPGMFEGQTKIFLGDDEEIRVTFRAQTFDDPQGFARALVERVVSASRELRHH